MFGWFDCTAAAAEARNLRFRSSVEFGGVMAVDAVVEEEDGEDEGVFVTD